jgi:hypothetical protein
MEWVWELYRDYVLKQLAAAGDEHPTDAAMQGAFMSLLSESRVTVLVQEPWQNSVRFKALARYDWNEMTELVRDPVGFLGARFGGGKYKLNFHQGWSFIATRNFKPDGEPKWKALAEIELEGPPAPSPAGDQP